MNGPVTLTAHEAATLRRYLAEADEALQHPDAHERRSYVLAKLEGFLGPVLEPERDR